MSILTNNITVQTRVITPRDAEQMLAKNTHNRKVSASNLAAIKNSLTRDEWRLNGEAIKIAADGQILDGQHRLLASVETGIAFETLIVTGLEADTQSTMDTGKSRSIGDVLTLQGYPNGISLAATIAGVIRREKYGMRAAVKSSSVYPVSTTEALERIRKEPTLEDLTRDTKKYGRIGLPGRIAAILFYEFSALDAEDAQFFFDRLWEGDGLERGSAILALRKSLLASTDTKGAANPVYLAAISIKAWNKYRAGEEAALLRFSPGGANPEKFPSAV